MSAARWRADKSFQTTLPWPGTNETLCSLYPDVHLFFCPAVCLDTQRFKCTHKHSLVSEIVKRTISRLSEVLKKSQSGVSEAALKFRHDKFRLITAVSSVWSISLLLE